MHGLHPFGALVFSALLAASTFGAQEPRSVEQWSRLLAEREVPLPEASSEVVWRDDLDAAFDEARDTGRPLFVTLRCLPCKQCAGFDQAVLEGGRRLDPWLARFVTVRLTDAAAVDLERFPVAGFQDTDLSWWGWFFAPDASVYGVFGGRDHVSDSTRISVPALVRTLERVARHHADPVRRAADLDGPAPDPRLPAFSPLEHEGFPAWRAALREEFNCLHCHQMGDVLRQPAIDAGSFDKQRDLQVWPLPENVGLELDRDHGLEVLAVAPGSPAARAGLRAGDELCVAGERVLFGQTDFRGVLHRAPTGDAELRVLVRRAGELVDARLEMEQGWKRTVLDWRMSASQGSVGGEPGFFPLAAKAGERKRAGVEPGGLAVQPFFGRDRTSPAWQAGLRPGHVIVAVDGESPALAGRAFLVWFRMQHEPGDTVRLTLASGAGERRELSYQLAPRPRPPARAGASSR